VPNRSTTDCPTIEFHTSGSVQSTIAPHLLRLFRFRETGCLRQGLRCYRGLHRSRRVDSSWGNRGRSIGHRITSIMEHLTKCDISVSVAGENKTGQFMYFTLRLSSMPYFIPTPFSALANRDASDDSFPVQIVNCANVLCTQSKKSFKFTARWLNASAG